MVAPQQGSWLAGRTAIVTGAGRGIGEAIALTLASQGAEVMVVGRSPEPLNTTVAAIEARGGRAFATPADISSPNDVTPAVDAAMARGGIDILVNNAAVFDEPPFFDLDVDTFRPTFDINVIGTFLRSQ
jgi:NAD(P)-dependent dehydrogenase (short-subunit alcohol dehydrogenase family)